MSLEKSPQQPAAPAQTSNQNTLILVIIAVLVIIAIILFSNMMQQGNNGSASNSSNTDRLIALRQSVAAKELELKKQGIALPTDTVSIEELSARISRDATELRTNIETFQQTLSGKEQALAKAQNDLQGVLTTNQHLSTEAANLRNQLAQLKGQQANIAYLNQEIESLKSQLNQSNTQIAALNTRPTNETVAQFRASLNDTMLTNEKLIKKIADLEAQALNSVDKSKLATLKAQLDNLIPENENLRLLVQQLRAENDYDSLYAKSAEDLRPEAALLYAELQKLEGLTPVQLELAYSRISEQHNAHMIRSVKFNTGSSDVDWSSLAQIKDTASSANPDSFLLVVGYASKTGDIENNRVLSAKRSVTIASVVKHLKKGAGTRAVYLGQTDRFSAQATDNQICEIWELRK